MDEIDLYGDLDEFHQEEEKKHKELLDWEEKYNKALNSIESLKEENAQLNKKIRKIEVNFQNLLDTARAEIRRKQRDIENLRQEKDDICFRRLHPNRQVVNKEEHPKDQINKQVLENDSFDKKARRPDHISQERSLNTPPEPKNHHHSSTIKKQDAEEHNDKNVYRKSTKSYNSQDRVHYKVRPKSRSRSHSQKSKKDRRKRSRSRSRSPEYSSHSYKRKRSSRRSPSHGHNDKREKHSKPKGSDLIENHKKEHVNVDTKHQSKHSSHKLSAKSVTGRKDFTEQKSLNHVSTTNHNKVLVESTLFVENDKPEKETKLGNTTTSKHVELQFQGITTPQKFFINIDTLFGSSPSTCATSYGSAIKTTGSVIEISSLTTSPENYTDMETLKHTDKHTKCDIKGMTSCEKIPINLLHKDNYDKIDIATRTTMSKEGDMNSLLEQCKTIEKEEILLKCTSSSEKSPSDINIGDKQEDCKLSEANLPPHKEENFKIVCSTDTSQKQDSNKPEEIFLNAEKKEIIVEQNGFQSSPTASATCAKNMTKQETSCSIDESSSSKKTVISKVEENTINTLLENNPSSPRESVTAENAIVDGDQKPLQPNNENVETLCPTHNQNDLMNKKNELYEDVNEQISPETANVNHHNENILNHAIKLLDALETEPVATQSAALTSKLPCITNISSIPTSFSGIFTKNLLEISREIATTACKKKSLDCKGVSAHKTVRVKEYILPAASVLCNADNLENATKETHNKRLQWKSIDTKREQTVIEDDAALDTTGNEHKEHTKLIDQQLIELSLQSKFVCLETLNNFDSNSVVACDINTKNDQQLEESKEKTAENNLKNKVSNDIKIEDETITKVTNNETSVTCIQKQRDNDNAANTKKSYASKPQKWGEDKKVREIKIKHVKGETKKVHNNKHMLTESQGRSSKQNVTKDCTENAKAEKQMRRIDESKGETQSKEISTLVEKINGVSLERIRTIDVPETNQERQIYKKEAVETVAKVDNHCLNAYEILSPIKTNNSNYDDSKSSVIENNTFVHSTPLPSENAPKKSKFNERKGSPAPSPFPNHSIFTDDNKHLDDDMPLRTPKNISQDDTFREIDTVLGKMFQSPQDKMMITDKNDKSNQKQQQQQENLSNEKIGDEAINESVNSNQENDQSTLNVTTCGTNDSTCLNSSLSSTNVTEVKYLSLGKSEYRFEKVSDNVVNLFISRKRKRKKTATFNDVLSASSSV